MTLYTDCLETPFGPFSVAVTADAAVAATAFGERDALRARLGGRTRRETRRARRALAPDDWNLIPDRARCAAVREQVLAYGAGGRREFTLPLQPSGTAFQQRVWQALAAIPSGETRTYAELALLLGTAPRAIGQANARNPICLIVPCHRVVGADGTLTGFAFGTELKERLLAHERELAAVERARYSPRSREAFLPGAHASVSGYGIRRPRV